MDRYIIRGNEYLWCIYRNNKDQITDSDDELNNDKENLITNKELPKK